MHKLFVIILLVALIPAAAFGQAAGERRGWGYAFAGVGGISPQGGGARRQLWRRHSILAERSCRLALRGARPRLFKRQPAPVHLPRRRDVPLVLAKYRRPEIGSESLFQVVRGAEQTRL